MSEFTKGDNVEVTAGVRQGKSGVIQDVVKRNGEVAAYFVAFQFDAGRYVAPDAVKSNVAPDEKPKIKAGDRVRVTKPTGPHTGNEGIVKHVQNGTNEQIATVHLDKHTHPNYVNYFYFSDLEIIDPLPAFKVGDRVRTPTGEIGTVEDRIFTRDGGEKWTYCVKLGYSLGRRYTEAGLELVEFLKYPEDAVVGEEIGHEQIKAGDKVRTIREFEDGFTLTMEGVAHRQRSDGAWMSPGVKGHCVAPKGTGPLAAKQTHILVERDEPKDWFVYSRYTISGTVEVQTLVGKTEKEAKELVKKWNKKESGKCGDRKAYWAQKVSK